MTPDIVAFLVGAGLLAGIVNALAGGGILVVLPALQVAGVAPVSAAASANVAVWPAHAIAAVAARDDLAGVRGRMQRSALVAMVGAAVGALLLLWSGDRLFRALCRGSCCSQRSPLQPDLLSRRSCGVASAKDIPSLRWHSSSSSLSTAATSAPASAC
jgi:Sulfite exporter TauE/SafE